MAGHLALPYKFVNCGRTGPQGIFYSPAWRLRDTFMIIFNYLFVFSPLLGIIL